MFCDSFGSCPPVTNKADSTACSLPNASSTCYSGICGGSKVLTCTTGFADCDSDLSNGCETDTQADLSNCGSCGNSCGAGASCDGGVCIPGPCASDADCTGPGERCDAGVCTVPPCASASDCPGTDTQCQTRICSAGACGFSNMPAGNLCDDSNACTTGDSCDGSGSCTGGTPLTCDDSNACTSDSCNPAGGCVNVSLPNGAGCGSGLTCQGGICQLP
jgi:hypothetical protein